jgi:hypothetical protein
MNPFELFPTEVWTTLLGCCDDQTALNLAATCSSIRACSSTLRVQLLWQRTVRCVEDKGPAGFLSNLRRKNRLEQIRLMVVAHARSLQKGNRHQKQRTILCTNSFERAFTHHLASACGLAHHGEIHYKNSIRPGHKSHTKKSLHSSVVLAAPTQSGSCLLSGDPQLVGLSYPIIALE